VELHVHRGEERALPSPDKKDDGQAEGFQGVERGMKAHPLISCPREHGEREAVPVQRRAGIAHHPHVAVRRSPDGGEVGRDTCQRFPDA
jgi:hypothetical protein